jgi:hypothetical protein
MTPRAPRYVLSAVLIALVTLTFFLSRLPEQRRAVLYGLVGVPAKNPPFFDMHFVLASLDCARRGIPATEVCPEAGYRFIYPKTFYLLLPTGLSARHTLPAAVAVFAGFIISMFAFLRSITWQQCCYVSILLCAPPTLLGLERCNVDLFLVSLLAVAILCLEARRWPVLALSAITLAALLKIYPIAALTSAVGRVRRSYLFAAAFACILGLGLQINHLRFINANILRSFLLSWGYPVAFLQLRELGWRVPEGIEHVLQVAAPAVSLLLAIRIVRRGCERLPEMRHLPGMVAGSSLYCFCWISGPNFEYRYLVLLLALPFLFNNSAKSLKGFTEAALAAMPSMFWLSLDPGYHLVTKLAQEILGLVLFCSLLTILLVFALQTIEQFEIPALKNVFPPRQADLA